MGIEIERKFLVRDESWKTISPVYFCQGYLNPNRERTVRVRVAGPQGFLTVKGINQGATRPEFEYEIPVEDAQQMLPLCEGPLIEKNRYLVSYDSMVWEIDEFLGENQGLVVAEIELETENQTFELPAWLGEEVTDDPRYFNSNLTRHPYCQW